MCYIKDSIKNSLKVTQKGQMGQETKCHDSNNKGEDTSLIVNNVNCVIEKDVTL